MNRRTFVASVGRFAVGARLALLAPFARARRGLDASLLVPMDDAQSDHLKAYGLTFRAIQAGGKVEWFLNYRGGSFLLPDVDAIRRDAALSGVAVTPVDDGAVAAMRGEIAAGNMDTVQLER
ncbi:MAG TPA: hypothetical protein VNX15_01335, partial [Gemmatimonadales bacterium]|nr:hypothetical protein [Gemmatimonadales bacterium]